MKLIVLTSGILAVSILLVFGLSSLNTITSKNSHSYQTESISIPHQTVITSKNIELNSETSKVIPVVFSSNSNLKQNMPLHFIDSAFAISSGTTTVTQTGWALPSSSAIFRLVSNSSNVYFTQNYVNKIGRLVPSTNTFSEWAIPVYLPGYVPSPPIAVTVDTLGNVFFTTGSAKIGRLIPSTNSITLWDVGIISNDIVTDSSGNVYFPAGQADQIARLAPSTNTLTVWNVTNNQNYPYLITLDSSGNIFFAENGGKIGQLNPNTNTLKLWKTPDQDSVAGMTTGPNNMIYFTEYSNPKIGRLDPGTNAIKTWMTPSQATLSLITVDSASNVYFVESNPNKIVRLVPSSDSFTEWIVNVNLSGISVGSSGDVFYGDNLNYLIGRLS